jgi:hypothetical protein
LIPFLLTPFYFGSFLSLQSPFFSLFPPYSLFFIPTKKKEHKENNKKKRINTRTGGFAIANAIFGDYNPGGKLPYTVYPTDYLNQVNMSNMDMSLAPGMGKEGERRGGGGEERKRKRDRGTSGDIATLKASYHTLNQANMSNVICRSHQVWERMGGRREREGRKEKEIEWRGTQQP